MIRDATEADIPVFFEHQRDPEALDMAKMPARDEEAFTAHWQKILADDASMQKTILFEGEVAGNLLIFDRGGKRLVGYWIGREFWGQGLATSGSCRAAQPRSPSVLSTPMWRRATSARCGSSRSAGSRSWAARPSSTSGWAKRSRKRSTSWSPRARLRVAGLGLGPRRHLGHRGNRVAEPQIRDQPGEREREHRRRRPPSGRPGAAPRRTPARRPTAPAAAAPGWRPDRSPSVRSAPAGSREASSAARRLAKIAPKSATPIEPPIWRKSVEPDVATPMFRGSTAFCTASTSTCITIPSPRPSTTPLPSTSQRRRADLQPREQEEPDRHQRRAGDRERLVAAPARDQVAAHDRRHEHARHQRRRARAPTSSGSIPS